MLLFDYLTMNVGKTSTACDAPDLDSVSSRSDLLSLFQQFTVFCLLPL